jgi:hypothetical protein
VHHLAAKTSIKFVRGWLPCNHHALLFGDEKTASILFENTNLMTGLLSKEVQPLQSSLGTLNLSVPRQCGSLTTFVPP